VTDKKDLPCSPCRSEISVAVILLAAGRSTRMSSDFGHKLLVAVDGVPLVRRVAMQAIESRATHVYVVTGFRHEDIGDCLADLQISIAFNPAFASGMASSLVAGLKIPGVMDHDGTLILLADMPAITAKCLNDLIAAFETSNGRAIVRASHAGTPGNPVILPNALYARALDLQGDRGAKGVIQTSDLDVVDVEIGEAAIFDIDTKEDLEKYGDTSRRQNSVRNL